jgi:hypothetical protein
MAEVRVGPEERTDLGNRFAQRSTLVAVGRSGGVAIRETQGFIYNLSPRGLIARQEWYWTWEDALAALERRD